jgi:ADP-ribose pyrophosphatase YjhB (NUDIX family)
MMETKRARADEGASTGMSDVIPSAARIPQALYQQITAIMPIPCVDLVIVRAGAAGPEVLIVKRAIEPDKGLWCIVGGRVIGGRDVAPERLAGAIARQAERELGVEVAVIPPWDANHPLAVFDDPECDPAKYPIVLVYPVEITKGTARTGPESSEVRWCPRDELPDVMGFTHREEIDAVIAEIALRGWPDQDAG